MIPTFRAHPSARKQFGDDAMTTEVIEECLRGVTPEVSAKMRAVNADLVDGDGMLFRTCEHGVKHPVGHLHRRLRLDGEFSDAKRHHAHGVPVPMIKYAACCTCCDDWPKQ